MKQTAQSRKINEAARTALASILLTQVADPRLSLVTVTDVEVSKDRSVANVYISADKNQYQEVQAGLESAKGRVRSLLGHELGWRVTPQLRFFIDDSIDEAQRISDVLGKHRLSHPVLTPAAAPSSGQSVPATPGQTLNLEQTLALLQQPRETVICGHVNPDGDAIGSGLALGALLRAMGHRVTSLLAKGDKPPELYSFFAGYDFTAASDYQGDPELFIVVDSPNKQRLGDGAELFDRAADNLVIDHHPDYDGFANHYFGDPTASATGLLIWQLIKASKLAITPQMAEYCYVALMTDTGRFAFQNTNPTSFIAAGEMIAAGADATDASMRVYDSKSLDALRLDARLISRISFAAGGRVVYSWVTEADFAELDVVRDETEGLPTILRSVKGTEIAILLREESGRVRVNLRAKGNYDVGEFARRFGGGGHKSAAGFTIDKTLDEAQALVLGKADCLFC